MPTTAELESRQHASAQAESRMLAYGQESFYSGRRGETWVTSTNGGSAKTLANWMDDVATALFNANQALSTANQAATLASAALQFPDYIPGFTYSTFAFTTSITGAVPAVDVLYLYPFYIHHAVTIKTLLARVLNGTASSMKTGIWANSVVSNRPVGAPLVADNTGVATSTNQSSPTVNVTDTPFTAGWYWVGSKFTGTLPTLINIPAYPGYISTYLGQSGLSPVAGPTSLADAYANDMPTIAEGAAFSGVLVAGVPIIGFTV